MSKPTEPIQHKINDLFSWEKDTESGKQRINVATTFVTMLIWDGVRPPIQTDQFLVAGNIYQFVDRLEKWLIADLAKQDIKCPQVVSRVYEEKNLLAELQYYSDLYVQAILLGQYKLYGVSLQDVRLNYWKQFRAAHLPPYLDKRERKNLTKSFNDALDMALERARASNF